MALMSEKANTGRVQNEVTTANLILEKEKELADILY